MNVTFFCAAKDRERDIARALTMGVRKHGDSIRTVLTADLEGPDDWSDVVMYVGVKGFSRLINQTYLAAGKHVIIIDKGHMGGPTMPRSHFYRVSVDSFQPLPYFQKMPRPDDRLRTLGIHFQPYRTKGEHVIIAGGSLKYAMWHQMNDRDGMDPATAWARDVVKKLEKRTSRQMIYRPKPSWAAAVPVEGTTFSGPKESIQDVLRHAWALVTYGSNAAVDAAIAGIPAVVLGDGIAYPIASHSWEEIESPRIPTDKERYQWAADVAYCQWTLKEFENGTAWFVMREQIEANNI
jgi:hypothetical protein